jgi:hypothetical protein
MCCVADDPLSAVDANVGRRIFDLCIRGTLRNKTIVFVTHQLQYLPQCDRVIFMANGRIAEAGTYDQLLAKNAGVEASWMQAAYSLLRPHAVLCCGNYGPQASLLWFAPVNWRMRASRTGQRLRSATCRSPFLLRWNWPQPKLVVGFESRSCLFIFG